MEPVRYAENMSDASSSTLGNERMGNWAFKEQTEEEFVEEILKDQPFIPSYFGFNVDINKTGPENVQRTKWANKLQLDVTSVEEGVLVVDVRDADDFKSGHLANSINIMARSESDKYETWLGAIVQPEEPFYLVLDSVDQLEGLLERTAKIGYEKQIKAVVTLSQSVSKTMEKLDVEEFKNHQDEYTIVDIRNNSEVEEGKIFESAIAIPLNELRDRKDELPKDKPLVVHCAGGYRSAAGSSILDKEFKDAKVFDLSDAIKDFQ